ncbi:ATP-binding cassette domain-containing protein [Psychrobacter sp. FDAARGOS_221]|uniref:ATP-binding cassette domain-containing protein n=1 Tax=Psychrobacter sp. FDAARGOS_221 TaxID=1975705 RepID=UPI000BB56BE2|nr:ATP-binding cassette domain-containing protein [Psychrobacter sp. FDAARGOS_221]PNK60097.1 iron ABC transporter ATP-binding protein [Psychrobacter sp. FDAARGOS_221]
MITLQNVSHHIDSHLILDNINLSLEDEQVIALIGPNGAGKSTLFSVMSRLQPLQSGSIHFGDIDITTSSSKILAKTVAILAQSNEIQGRLRVAELLMFGRYPYHQGRPTELDRQKVAEVIERFELQSLAQRDIATLSGGQRQRVLIAMIVCQDTPYLLLDEPLNNLDMYHSGRLMRALRKLAHTDKKTIVIVIHDINQAAQFADTVVMMKSGKIIKTGQPIDVLTQNTIEDLYGVKATVIEHNGYPVIIDSRD